MSGGGAPFWDERFGGADYFYGTQPNDFLAAQATQLRGPVLSLAEGEGRNAVFLAQQGLDVLGVDASAAGLQKAELLAQQRGVCIRTQQADLAVYAPAEGAWGAVVSIFAHLPGALRAQLYPKVQAALRPGGLLVLEAYSEQQPGYGTGGPQALDLLMSVDKVRAGFPGLEPVLLQQIEREVVEGQGHTGLASVVQFVGRKPG